METVEIFGNGGLMVAAIDLGLNTLRCVYTAPQGSALFDFQIWELSKEEFDKLLNLEEGAWDEDWGWWRWFSGSNMTSKPREYIIHGMKIKAWDGHARENYSEVCRGCDDFFENCHRVKDPCFATDKDQTQCFRPREYENIIEYLCNEIGASTLKNVGALSTHLAQINNIKLSELFRKYLG